MIERAGREGRGGGGGGGGGAEVRCQGAEVCGAGGSPAFRAGGLLPLPPPAGPALPLQSLGSLAAGAGLGCRSGNRGGQEAAASAVPLPPSPSPRPLSPAPLPPLHAPALVAVTPAPDRD